VESQYKRKNANLPRGQIQLQIAKSEAFFSKTIGLICLIHFEMRKVRENSAKRP
jgi:hypothetical protein